MNRITQNAEEINSASKRIEKFFTRYKIGKILADSNARKEKGIAVKEVMKYLFSLVFIGQTMFMQMQYGRQAAPFCKDTVYRFLNSVRINWLHFTTMLSAAIIKESIVGLTDEKRENVLIIDDTLYSRARSKSVELLTRVYDHARHLYTKGFRLLTLLWNDGNTAMPVNACLLSSENKTNVLNPPKAVAEGSNGEKRRKMAVRKATEVLLELLSEARKAAIPARYVLFDTWFCSPSMLTNVKKLGYDVIAMAKKTSKVHYVYNGEKLPVNEIYRRNRKRPGKSHYLLSAEASITSDASSLPVRLVFVRNRNKRSQWLVLVSTDMTLSEDDIIRIYGKRWAIEVFFKVAKSKLKLNGECESLSYDAMTAHCAIVFTRYMMLALEERERTDDRSIGGMFLLLCDELDDITLAKSLELLMNIYTDFLEDYLLLDVNVVNALIDKFLSALPDFLRLSVSF